MQNSDVQIKESFLALTLANPKKSYIKKINKATKKYIKTKAYVLNINKRNLGEACLPYLDSMVVNQKFCDDFSFVPSLKDKYDGFSFLTRLASYNWFETLISMFQQDVENRMKPQDTEYKGVQKPDFDFKDLVILLDHNDNTLNLKELCYFESYILNSVIYEKRYFVLTKFEKTTDNL